LQIQLPIRNTSMLLLDNLGIIVRKDDASRSPELYGENDA
jgi:hypothetical protein